MMTMTTVATSDLELVGQYARTGSDAAFTELARRHLDLVYSAALRQVRSPQLAEEVAQSVFTDLSRGAGRLKPGTFLTAWLYQVTRRTAVDVVRRESRRQLREQLATEIMAMNSHPSIWTQIEPLLDEAMETLEAPERDAILLRFFENKSLREIGVTFGTSEDAAQKRVSRAVGRLRQFLARRGVAVGAGGLAAALAANAVQAAPAGLMSAISIAAHVTGAALQHSATISTTKAFLMTTTQKMFAMAIVTAVTGAGVYEARLASKWHTQATVLARQTQPLTDQVRQLQQERDEAAARLAAARQENEDLRRRTAEVPKLRGEVARLRDSARELAQLKAAGGSDPALDATMKTWAARATSLRKRLEQSPGQRIPELQLLTEKNWFDAVKDLKQFESEDDYSKALSNARNIAKGEFGSQVQKALRGYTDANNGQLPSDMSQLKPFFDTPIDDSILSRYKMLQTGNLADVPHDQYLVADIAPLIDPDNDATFQFQMTGTWSHAGNPIEEEVRDAGIQYAQANNGLLPTDASQLTPYIKHPFDPAVVQQVLGKIPPGVTTLQQLQAATEFTPVQGLNTRSVPGSSR